MCRSRGLSFTLGLVARQTSDRYVSDAHLGVVEGLLGECRRAESQFDCSPQGGRRLEEPPAAGGADILVEPAPGQHVSPGLEQVPERHAP